MKNLKLTLVALLLVFLSTSCEQKPSELASTSFDDFFDETIEKYQNIEEDHAVYISYAYDENSEKLSVKDVEVKELDFFPLITSRVENGGGYTIDCTIGEDVTTSDCSGTYSCGQLIKDCLDAGGCAEICEAQIIFLPKARTFFLVSRR